MIIDKKASTIEEVYKLFKSFSDNVHYEKIKHSNYDYLIYFEDDLISKEHFYMKKLDDRIIYNCYVKTK